MLDSGCSMLDNLHAIGSGIHKHPETSTKVFLETASMTFISNAAIRKIEVLPNI